MIMNVECLKRPHIFLQGERIHDLFIKSYVFDTYPTVSVWYIHLSLLFPCSNYFLPDNSTLWKWEGTWNRNASRNNCSWDRYWWRVGQLLADFFPSLVMVPEVFAKKITWRSSPLISKVANGVLSGEWL